MSNFAITVSWDGQVVVGVESVTPLRETVEVVTLHEGGSPVVHKVPGRSDVEAVTLARGVTSDLAFDLWATGPLLRKEVELELLDSSDGLTVVYRLHRCWVSAYAVSPDPATGVVTESLTLTTEGWERVTPTAVEVADGIARLRGSVVQRVHLASLIRDSAGETESTLVTALDEARRSGAVLLLDEADALFAQRTQVQDAHDRYAATEADGIRDVLARYQGQVVVVPPDAP